ncbi:glycosyltransferase family 4 protein [Allopontixanthobacter sediminis]|nr:glycosyltransferase family 4 protein [Allopontixanthobacter sediminis]
MIRAARTIAIVANGAFSIINFRGELISDMVGRGARVFALAPDFDEELRRKVRELGAEPVDIELDRMGMRPVADVINTFKLRRKLRTLAPDIVFSYFLKPVVFGTLAAWLAGVPRRYALVAGLGYVFIEPSDGLTAKRRLLRRVVMGLCKLSFSRCHAVFFQNAQDLSHFVDAGVLGTDRAILTDGTGVNLDHFVQSPLPEGAPRLLFVGRLLREKGIREFVDAAIITKQTRPDCEFVVAGDADPNPGGIGLAEIEQLRALGVCSFLGHVDDIRIEIERCTIFVLPSYREGMPRSTQEALAMGRPIITTDAVGCRETVIAGGNGWLVPVGDAPALADAMIAAVSAPRKLEAMAQASRALAENRFNVRTINAKLLDAMGV